MLVTPGRVKKEREDNKEFKIFKLLGLRLF